MKIEEITRRYREEHGLSQRQFAAQCGLSAPYIWYLEQGIHPQTGKRIQPSISSLNKIAQPYITRSNISAFAEFFSFRM